MEEASSEEAGESRPDGQTEIDAWREQRFHFGAWTFNVRRGLLIAERSRRLGRLPVEPWASWYGLREGSVPILGRYDIDEPYALATDLGRPVLVATMRNKRGEAFPLLIDGLHRVYRAHLERVPQLPAYVLNVQESYAIREDGLPDVPRYEEQPDRRPRGQRRPGGDIASATTSD